MYNKTKVQEVSVKYIDPINDVLQRIQEGLKTQDLNQIEVQLLIDRFGHNWFEELGYNNLKPHKEPIFTKAF